MREIYLKDKNKNISFRSVQPHNDENCLPYDYFRLNHALLRSKNYSDYIKAKNVEGIPEDMINKQALADTDAMIENELKKSMRNPYLFKLLAQNFLSYKEQKRLLKGITLTSNDILWFNKDAQNLGYLMDIYHEEKYPAKFDEKNIPVCFHQQEDGSIETIGRTDMTDGEMRALLEQRKVVQARIYHKNEYWHCFYFTFKGLSGEEHGPMGSVPHYHYISDKSGITREELNERIKACNMPTSKVHIVIDK